MGGAPESLNQEKEPNVASDAFNFMGERAPVPRAPQMESKPAQIVAGFYNGAVAPTIDFMASPAGLATSAIPFAGQAASRIASAAFAPVAFKGMEEARQRANVVAKDPNATLQQKVEPIAEAATQGLMGIGAATHAIPAPEIGKLGITPNKGMTAKSMEEIDKGLEEAASPVTQFPTSEKGFYSQLQNVLHEKMPNNASVDQIRAIIDPAKGIGVKPDEIKWSNLEGFLEGKKNATKQEVLDYLKNEGAVKFEERMFGAKPEEVLSPADEKRLSFLEKENQKSPLGAIDDTHGEGSYEELMRLQNIRDKSTTDQLYAKQEQIERGARHLQKTDPKKADALWKEAQHYTARAEALELWGAGMSEQPKFGQYTIPNGENYREINLVGPSIEGWKDFPRGHAYGDFYDPVNVNRIAHMRLNERPDSEGNKGLFIEELQSDRHQAGREKGYEDPAQKEKMKELGVKEKAISDKLIELRKKWEVGAISDAEMQEREELKRQSMAISKQISDLNESGRIAGVPDAPFRKDWHTQLFKRALRDAVDKGHDWIGWTSGDTQAGRYDLSKQVRDISYRPNDGELQARGIDGGRAISKSGVTPDKLESFVGKEVAKKLLEQPTGGHFSRADGMGMGWHTLSGQDLKVGGEGMKGFYDKILPNEIGKYVKKWGGKVEEGSVGERADEATWRVEYPNGRRGTVYTEDAAESAKESGAKVTPSETKQTPIWKVKITPEMRKSIQQGGQPQVSKDTDIFANLV